MRRFSLPAFFFVRPLVVCTATLLAACGGGGGGGSPQPAPTNNPDPHVCSVDADVDGFPYVLVMESPTTLQTGIATTVGTLVLAANTQIFTISLAVGGTTVVAARSLQPYTPAPGAPPLPTPAGTVLASVPIPTLTAHTTYTVSATNTTIASVQCPLTNPTLVLGTFTTQ